jgi:Tfp pilus assembly protein PilN
VLRNNLSTRPFYNERAVHAVLGLVGLVVLVLTVINLYEIVRLSRQNTELSSRVDQNRSEAAKLTREAARIRKGINQQELELVVNAAREANTIIEQRTFSWTAFFNHIENTLPPDVMLTAVQPTITDEGTRVALTVVGRRIGDIDEFMEKLEATGAFENVQNRQIDYLENGNPRVVIESQYVHAGEPTEKPSGTPTPPAPKTPEPAGRGSAAKGDRP